MDKCKDYVQLDDFEATVITLAMVHEAVDGGAPGKEKRSSRRSGLLSTARDETNATRDTDLDSVEKLILPVKGIYRIDHLWTLPNLTNLNLSCNNIQFIENINCLPHLTKLNLACNQIRKIENIDQLALLEIFIIHNNQIMEIQNLGNAKELKIFNVKNNKLEKFEETVLYLRRFKCLRSLCAIGNPCFETFESDVEGYIIAHLPQLVYFEYKLITRNTQEKCREFYARDIERLEAEEQRIAYENSREENDDKHLSDQKLAFVENLNRSQLFELMQDRDPYSHIMIMMKGDMPSICQRYQQDFNVYTQQLFQMGKEEYQKREKDLNDFNQTFEKLKTEVNEKNRKIVEDFIGRKAFIFYDISQIIQEKERTEDVDEQKTGDILVDALNIEDHDVNIKFVDDQKPDETKINKTNNLPEETDNSQKDTQDETNVENHLNRSFDTNGSSSSHLNDNILALNEVFHETCNKTYDDLMKSEDILHEQLMDLMKTLDRVYLNSHVDNFIRKAQLLFTHLRDVVRTYMDIINETSRRFFNKNIGSVNLPAQLAQILISADTLASALDMSDRAHLDTIDDREETMLTNIEQWHKDLMENMREDEIDRHRRCVNEICHLIDINREELDDIVGDLAFVDRELLL